VTEVKSGPAFQKVEGSELVAVMRRNPDLAKDYAQRHNVPKWYSDANDIINNDEIDAVYIAAPPAFHKEYTIAASRAGKHVYVEKPMALNYNDCLEMISECEKNHIKLFVAYYRPELEKFKKIKTIIDEKRIGEIEKVEIILNKKLTRDDAEGKYNWRVDRKVSGGGYFYDLACHQINLLQYYLGITRVVKNSEIKLSSHYNAEDYVQTDLIFDNGVLCSGSWNFDAASDDDFTIINGEKGSIRFSTFTDEPVVLKIKKRKENILFENPEHIQMPLIKQVVENFLQGGLAESNMYSAAQTTLIMDCIMKSAAKITSNQS